MTGPNYLQLTEYERESFRLPLLVQFRGGDVLSLEPCPVPCKEGDRVP